MRHSEHQNTLMPFTKKSTSDRIFRDGIPSKVGKFSQNLPVFEKKIRNYPISFAFLILHVIFHMHPLSNHLFPDTSVTDHRFS